MKKFKVLMLCCVAAAAVCLFAACGAKNDGTATQTPDTNNVGDDTQKSDSKKNTTDSTQNGGSVGKDLEDMGDDVVDGAKDAGDAVKDGVEDAGDAVKDGVEDMENNTKTRE